MKQEFTTRLLAYVSSEINSGHALWAMFWANNYLDKEDPLRLGLHLKAKKKLIQDSEFDDEGQAILEHIRKGLSLAELSPVLRARLKREKEQSKQDSLPNLNFLMNRRSHRTRAQAMRNRRAPIRESRDLLGMVRAREHVSAPRKFRSRL